MDFRIPTRIETVRLVLRQFRQEDWKALHAYYADAESTRYTLGKVLTEAETWWEMAIRSGHWLLHGYRPYAVEERTAGAVIGMVGPWFPLDWPEPEITWHLVRAATGRGFAREAAEAVLAAVREHLPEIPFIGLIHPDNRASIRLAEAVGARFERKVTFRNGEWCVYRHRRPKLA
jgi:RimJ/RimL family protein N-acetyltransferase